MFSLLSVIRSPLCEFNKFCSEIRNNGSISEILIFNFQALLHEIDINKVYVETTAILMIH